MEIGTPDGFIYCEIQKGMYGLPQARQIACEITATHRARQRLDRGCTSCAPSNSLLS